MKYAIAVKGTSVFITAHAKTDPVAEHMIKKLETIVKGMNKFKPEATVEYRGAEFDVEYETYPEVIGDRETGKTLYSVERIGINGILLDDETAQALNPTIFEDLSDALTKEMNQE